MSNVSKNGNPEQEKSILSQVITVNEAVTLTGWNVRKVQRLCKSGSLTARYADGIWLILKSSVKAPTQ